jgi:glutathione synthase/RimK-type ligase-like ATP-grasp enzyme
MRIILATCRTWPQLSTSDQCLAAALRDRDHAVGAAPWNGTFVPFQRADVVVVRSTWDYPDAPDAYATWLARLDPRRTFNAPALIRWNLSKRYLLDLATRGARVPRSRESAAEPTAVAAALDALALRDAVIKPLIGASGVGVERVRRGDEAAALARAGEGTRTERVLVQEFLPGIAAGEVAGVFFGGRFSHGLRRVPAPGEFRINSQYGGHMEAATLTDDVVAQMRAVLGLLPDAPVYARVDGVMAEAELVTMEVEVNEPGLGLNLAPGSAERFADALLERLT